MFLISTRRDLSIALCFGSLGRFKARMRPVNTRKIGIFQNLNICTIQPRDGTSIGILEGKEFSNRAENTKNEFLVKNYFDKGLPAS